MNRLVRQTHRWISALFVAIVVAIMAMQATGTLFAEWIYYLPLLPLVLLMLTGTWMFVLPYLRRQ